MTAELIIADVISEWTEQVIPGDTACRDSAVAYALHSYASGASVTEACKVARRMVISRSRHPSSVPVGRRRLATAS